MQRRNTDAELFLVPSRFPTEASLKSLVSLWTCFSTRAGGTGRSCLGLTLQKGLAHCCGDTFPLAPGAHYTIAASVKLFLDLSRGKMTCWKIHHSPLAIMHSPCTCPLFAGLLCPHWGFHPVRALGTVANF